MFNFAVTVKKNNCKAEEATIGHYEEWIANAALKGFRVKDVVYERDPKGRLHMHGIGTHEKSNFLRRRLLLDGYHQRIDILPNWLDLSHWNEYMLKEQYQEYQFVDPDEYEG